MGKHLEKWITTLITQLDEYVDPETKAKILEACGRGCQTESFVLKAKEIYENSETLDHFIEEFGREYEHLHRDGDDVFIIYPHCFCPFVNEIPSGELSESYCNCSRGWAKALFEGALGTQIDVIIEESIVKGDSRCKFKIILE